MDVGTPLYKYVSQGQQHPTPLGGYQLIPCLLGIVNERRTEEGLSAAPGGSEGLGHVKLVGLLLLLLRRRRSMGRTPALGAMPDPAKTADRPTYVTPPRPAPQAGRTGCQQQQRARSFVRSLTRLSQSNKNNQPKKAVPRTGTDRTGGYAAIYPPPRSEAVVRNCGTAPEVRATQRRDSRLRSNAKRQTKPGAVACASHHTSFALYRRCTAARPLLCTAVRPLSAPEAPPRNRRRPSVDSMWSTDVRRLCPPSSGTGSLFTHPTFSSSRERPVDSSLCSPLPPFRGKS
jgi:hypothetical protein